MTPDEIERIGRELNMRIPDTKPTAITSAVTLIEAMDRFVDAVIQELPKSGVYTPKQYDWGKQPSLKCMCGHHDMIEKSEFKTPREISDIERAFRKVVGSAVVEALLDDEALWEALAAGEAPDGEGSPIYTSHMVMADKASAWAYSEAKKRWDERFSREGQPFADKYPMKPSRMNVSPDMPWLRYMNREGYLRVRDKVKKQYIPEIKQYITKQAMDGVPYNEIASGLAETFKYRKRWDWLRLVRTEMAISQSKSVLAEYENNGIPFVQWSTSRAGEVCDDCEKLNNKRFFVTDMTLRNAEDNFMRQIETLADVPAIPQHPNCRCVLIPSWGERIRAPRTTRVRRGTTP